MYGSRIKTLRLFRNFSQEYMASELGIEQTTYSRIETNKQKLTVDMVKKIADVLGVSAGDITSNEPLIIQNNNSTIGAQGKIENYYESQKEVYVQQLKDKDKEIDRLVKQIALLMKQNEQLMKLVGRK